MDHFTFMLDTWRSVTVPVVTVAAMLTADRRGPELHERVMDELRVDLHRQLDQLGVRPVADIEVWVEEDVMHDHLIYRAMVRAADTWEDGAWTSVRAAVAEDQAVLQQGGH